MMTNPEPRKGQRGQAWLELPFQVKCERFEVTTYPDGTPEEYRSDLSFLEKGGVALRGPLRVNHPMEHGGYVFYQASYGSSAAITIEAALNPGGTSRRIRLHVGETGSLDPEGRVLTQPMRYDPNLQGKGPAVHFAFARPGEHPVTGWIWKGSRSQPLEGWTVGFVDVQEKYWTGIQVKRDPGTTVWRARITTPRTSTTSSGSSPRPSSCTGAGSRSRRS